MKKTESESIACSEQVILDVLRLCVARAAEHIRYEKIAIELRREIISF